MNLIDRATVERHDVEGARRRGLDIGNDTEVAANLQGFALRHLVKRHVVGDAIRQARIVEPNLPAVTGQVEMEQGAVLRLRDREPDEEVAVELRSRALGRPGSRWPPAPARVSS